MNGPQDPTLHLGPREVPVPTDVSPEAQAIIALGALRPDPVWPALGDIDAWIEFRKEADEMTLAAAQLAAPIDGPGCEIEDIIVGEFTVFDIRPADLHVDDPRVYLEIHGAFVNCGGEVCRTFSQRTAQNIRARVWSVDYRMAPEHPFPTSLDDCLTTYRRLLDLHNPDEIVVGGASAGGNLSAALMHRLYEEGLPMPAALVLETPVIDMTMASDTWRTNDGLDQILPGDLAPVLHCYATGNDMRSPHLSPIYGDLGYFPPTILTSGTRDRLLSDTCRTHRALRAAGVHAELHVWEAAGHAMFLGTAPEDDEKATEIRRFVNRYWKA
jgi:acetyl esterase/lipase